MPEAKIHIFLSNVQNCIYCFKYQLCTENDNDLPLYIK